jgi:activator of HSP90 ATPase
MEMMTRRDLALGALALGSASAVRAQSNAGPVAAAKAIHQEEDFGAAPKRIYEVLLDSKQFRAFSGRAAEISRDLGGTFSVFDGHIGGRYLELIPGRRIVQSWRVVTWPEGIHSIARFELQARGAGTRLILDHTGFPSDLAEHLAEGWQENYWTLLRKYTG